MNIFNSKFNLQMKANTLNPAISRFSEAAGQMFDEDVSCGSGILISPTLFLTAGHCALPEFGEYVLLDDGSEEYVRAKALTEESRNILRNLSKKELAEVTANLQYNPNVELEDVEAPVQELNQGLKIAFYSKEGEQKHNVGGKVVCAIYSEDYSLDFALIELKEAINDIETPELSAATAIKSGYIFHYPQGGERTLSVAQMSETTSGAHDFKLTYQADTKDQSSGSAILSEAGTVVGIHTNRDLLVEETLDEEEELEEVEERFSKTDGKFVQGVPIVEILKFKSKATDRLINALALNGVRIDGVVPTPKPSAATITQGSQLSSGGASALLE